MKRVTFYSFFIYVVFSITFIGFLLYDGIEKDTKIEAGKSTLYKCWQVVKYCDVANCPDTKR